MMKKWIRWKGLSGFAIAVIVLMLFFILFIDSIIKNSVESTGSRMVGAKVELGSADFHFSPFGMEFARLQVTDPERPMRNIIDIKHISFHLDGLSLLRRKILINEMQVDGVRLNTPRKTSGALKRRTKPADTITTPETKDKDIKLRDINIPDANKILAAEKLKTLKQAEDFKTNIKISEQNWGKIRQNMPDDKHLDGYNKRLEKIKQTNIQDIKQLSEAVKALNLIKKEIKADLDYIDSSHKQISGDLGQLNRELKDLKDSPAQEYTRLVNKYAPSDSAIGNISYLLFGSDVKKYTSMALDWYKKIEPWLNYVDFTKKQSPAVARLTGLNVRFREYNPSPEFLIKLIRASIETQQGNFSGNIMDVTNEQNITRRPTTLKFTGNKMQGIGSILVTGNFNHIEPDKAKDQLNFNMTDYRLKQYRLIDKDDMTISFDKAKADIKLAAGRENNKIIGDFKSHIHSIEYNTQASGNELARMVLTSIKETRNFNIDAKLRGTLDDYSVNISSDLDARLKNKMKQYMNRRLAGFKTQLKDKINLQVNQPINEAEGQFEKLQTSIENDIAKRKAKLTQQFDAVEAELKQKEDEASKKAKDKVEKKLKGLLDKYK